MYLHQRVESSLPGTGISSPQDGVRTLFFGFQLNRMEREKSAVYLDDRRTCFCHLSDGKTSLSLSSNEIRPQIQIVFGWVPSYHGNGFYDQSRFISEIYTRDL